MPSADKVDVPKYLVHPSDRLAYDGPDQTSIKKNNPILACNKGPTYQLSGHNGWVSVNKSENLGRKNAPEVSKVPLSDAETYQFKPNWMQTMPQTMLGNSIPT